MGRRSAQRPAHSEKGVDDGRASARATADAQPSAPSGVGGGGDADWVVGELLKTSKYRGVCEDVLLRTARNALEGRRRKDALKVAKRKLHQVFGAYGDGDWIGQVEAALSGMPEDDDPHALRTACREAMRLHASTEERLIAVDILYEELFRVTGRPMRMLDLACGLNPLTVPWMDLPPDSTYLAVDLDRRLAGILGRFLARFGTGFEARCGDALGETPGSHWDVVLAMKALPVFEQQEKGVARRVLDRYPQAWVVASFPVKSLGGHERGMAGHYADFARALGEAAGRPARMLTIASELFSCHPPARTA